MLPNISHLVEKHGCDVAVQLPNSFREERTIILPTHERVEDTITSRLFLQGPFDFPFDFEPKHHGIWSSVYDTHLRTHVLRFRPNNGLGKSIAFLYLAKQLWYSENASKHFDPATVLSSKSIKDLKEAKFKSTDFVPDEDIDLLDDSSSEAIEEEIEDDSSSNDWYSSEEEEEIEGDRIPCRAFVTKRNGAVRHRVFDDNVEDFKEWWDKESDQLHDAGTKALVLPKIFVDDAGFKVKGMDVRKITLEAMLKPLKAECALRRELTKMANADIPYVLQNLLPRDLIQSHSLYGLPSPS